jgi:hypothetical protein
MSDGNGSRGWIIFAICLLGFGYATQVRAQAFRNSEYYYTSATRLNDAHANLARARPVYKGHRFRAMQHIRAAARLSGIEIVHQNIASVPLGDSDVRLRTAQRILEQTRYGLPAEALEHVQKAIDEIYASLSVSQESKAGTSREWNGSYR